MSTEKINRRARSFLRGIDNRIEDARKDGATLVPLCRASDKAAQTVVAKKSMQHADVVLIEHDGMLCARAAEKDRQEIVHAPAVQTQSVEERLSNLESRLKKLEQKR
jgi:hypothetical protein